MKQPLRRKATYANVVATLALFIALGGASAFAATQLGKNSVGPAQLKKNAVVTAKVKNGAITGPKIKLSSLGTVPSATSAQTLDGQTSAQLTASSKISCPAGMTLAAGACLETVTREKANLTVAFEECGKLNRRLPSMGEATAFGENHVTGKSPFEWVEPMYLNGLNPYGSEVSASNEGQSVTFAVSSTQVPYRCATSASN